jgi:formylglycine-generating enzyme required for sulfatase activity
VEQVSWEDCQKFLDKLNEKVGPGGGKFQLPTEAQWEYACRAGSTTKYFFGNDEKDLGEYAWFIKNSDGKEHPVGEKKPNAWGLYDMHGNVWQWCQDRYYVQWLGRNYYKESPVDDPPGPAVSAAEHVYRGGSWYDPAEYCRSAFRYSCFPDYRCGFLGFRVARVPTDK